MKCAKCEGQMIRGFNLDRGADNTRYQSVWVEGAPESSLFRGVKLKGKPIYAVISYRCEKCGYLESYARDETTLGFFS